MSKGMPNALDACKTDLFSSETELNNKYPQVIADKIIRLRGLYNYVLANPDLKDKQIIETCMTRYNVEKSAAYGDLSILKKLLPMISGADKAYHRWRYNEMILETYQLSKDNKDTKTMERAASSYAKFNRVDVDDEQTLPYDLIVVQPFVATADPSVLGIKPIPNIQEKIDLLIAKYKNENMDIEDVDFDEYDLQEDELFNENVNDSTESEGNIL